MNYHTKNLSRIGHIVFDVDGTLVDNLSLIVESFNLAIADHVDRKFSNKEAYALFGPTLEQMIADFVPPAELEDAIERYHSHYEKTFKTSAQAYDGIHEVIRSLRDAGIGVGACTGSSRRMTETTLRQSDLTDLFSSVITADDVSSPKPNPESVLLTLRRMRANPTSTVCLGDSVRDIEASKRAGVRSAAVLWGFGNESELTSANPDFTFRNTYDILRLFE